MVSALNQAGMFNPAKGIFGLSNEYAGNAQYNLGGSIFSSYGAGVPARNYVQNRAEALALNDVIGDLAESIENNNSTVIADRFESYKEAYKQTVEYKALTKDGPVSEKVLNAILADKYYRTTGQNIKAHITEKASGNFWSGFFNGMALGIPQDKSSTQLQKKLLGKEEPVGSGVARVTGSVMGGATTGAAIGAGIGAWVGGIGAVPGAAIGAVIGAASGFISKIWS